MDFTVIEGNDKPYEETQTHVEDAVRLELADIATTDDVLKQVAIELAKQVDAGRNVAGASRELRMCMKTLRSGDGVVQAADDLDELQAKRDVRRKANG